MTSTETNDVANSGPSPDNVADVLTLLPLQRALLLLGESKDEDPGLLQVRCVIEGPLQPDTLRTAWETAVTWHPALRMSVWSPESGDPKAIVWKKVVTPWEYRDQAGALSSEFLESDRKRGIDVEALPPWRITLTRSGATRHELTWTCHHVFFDGWSSAVVLEDAMSIYRHLAAGEAAPSPPPQKLRDFYNARHDGAGPTLEAWWRQYLAGFAGNPTLPGGREAPRSTTSLEVASSTTDRLKRVAATWGATDNAIVQACLAIAMSRLGTGTDIVFGTTVSGRHLDVDAIDRMVGYLANTVPIRVTLDDQEKVSDLVRRLRTNQFEMQPYEHASLAEIHQWTGLPGLKPLFDVFVVVENFPLAQVRATDDVKISGFRSDLTSAYPVTVAVTFEEGWRLKATTLAGGVDQEWVSLLIETMASALTGLATDPEATVGALKDRLVAEYAVGFALSEQKADDLVEYDLPVTQMEHEIARVWERVFGVTNIGVHEDYFDLGGTSMLALRLFDEIEYETGVRLPLRTILASPTVAGLAAAADGRNPVARWKSLVPIRDEGDGTPLFCVHSGGGNALTYRDLARALASARPVYGLTAVGLNGEAEPLDSIPQMAHLYIEEMRTIQPVGPYVLIGHCFGGSVCLEMAHQLEESGETVALIVGIDATLPLPEPTSLWGKALRVLRARGMIGLAQAFKRRFTSDSAPGSTLLWDGSPAESGALQDEMRRRVTRANQHAFKTFQAPAVGSAKLIIKSLPGNAAEDLYWTFDWDSVGTGTEFVVVDASHTEILRNPWVKDVAKIIDERLSD